MIIFTLDQQQQIVLQALYMSDAGLLSTQIRFIYKFKWRIDVGTIPQLTNINYYKIAINQGQIRYILQHLFITL